MEIDLDHVDRLFTELKESYKICRQMTDAPDRAAEMGRIVDAMENAPPEIKARFQNGQLVQMEEFKTILMGEILDVALSYSKQDSEFFLKSLILEIVNQLDGVLETNRLETLKLEYQADTDEEDDPQPSFWQKLLKFWQRS